MPAGAGRATKLSISWHLSNPARPHLPLNLNFAPTAISDAVSLTLHLHAYNRTTPQEATESGRLASIRRTSSTSISAIFVEALDASLEDLLTRVDEFVGMLDMLRGDSSHVVSEGVPRIYAKATEMRQGYSKIDRLEAFVGMIGASVARMEEQVARAEAELGAFPSAFRKLLHTITVPSFFNKAPSSRPQQSGYEPPVLFRTEDHFPCCSERPQS
uniref:Biogenesis of lysosomal organelles complex 1 subunit 4 n=1 Tax=Ursus maritimus TaxID=29073 RepID=A0A452U2X4_URSMA